MRPVLHSDLIFAARALMALPSCARATAADHLIARADAADRYRRRFGRAHADWGNGTLMALACKTTLPPEPSLRDPAYTACLAAVLAALADRRDGPQRQQPTACRTCHSPA